MMGPPPGRLARLEDYRAGAVRRGPETVHIDLSNACNLNCIACWSYSPLLPSPRPASWRRRMADPERVAALLRDIHDLGGERVIFSGSGDPGTHPALYDLVACASGLGLHVALITNLTLVDPQRLLAAGVSALLVNVWAATSATYAATHPNQKPETHDRLAQKLRELRSREVALVFVACRPNAHEVIAMVDFAARVGAPRIQYKLASTSGPTDAVGLTDAEKRRILGQEPELRRRLSEAGIAANLGVFLAQLRGHAEGPPAARTGCYAGWFYSRVTVEGRVLLCCKHQTQVGDLSNQSFREIWTGNAYEALRQRLRAGDLFPFCAQCGNLDLNAAIHALDSAQPG